MPERSIGCLEIPTLAVSPGTLLRRILSSNVFFLVFRFVFRGYSLPLAKRRRMNQVFLVVVRRGGGGRMRVNYSNVGRSPNYRGSPAPTSCCRLSRPVPRQQVVA